METLAGLIPIKHQIDKLMKSTIARTRTLHRAHPIRTNLNKEEWYSNRNNVKHIFAHGYSKRKKQTETPITLINEIAIQQTDEKFDILHDECQSGQRIVDKYKSRIHYYNFDNHPKKDKDSEEFRKWMDETY